MNAANNSLLGGGGVDGAIHRAAGPHLLKSAEHSRDVKPDPPSGPKATTCRKLGDSYRGARWRGGNHDEDRLLADCYRNCLKMAKKRDPNYRVSIHQHGAYAFRSTELHIAIRDRKASRSKRVARKSLSSASNTTELFSLLPDKRSDVPHFFFRAATDRSAGKIPPINHS